MKPRRNLRKKIKYLIENQISSGMKGQLKLLIIPLVLIILIFAIIFTIVNAANGVNFISGLFSIVMHIIDPGYFSNELFDNMSMSNGYVIFLLVVTIIGIVVLTTFIGIVTNALESSISILKKGKSLVMEENHVLILGAGITLPTLIDELLINNQYLDHPVIVVMDSIMPKDEMDETIRSLFPDTGNTRIVTRHGNISDITALNTCSVTTCKSVIINAENDALAIKSILAVTHLLSKNNCLNTHVVAMIRDTSNIAAAQIAGGKYLEAISYNDIISRIISHASRSAGLSEVYTNLLSYRGSDLYLEQFPTLEGVAMFEINQYFQNAVVIGIKRADGRILINPPITATVEKNDTLIMFQDHAGVSRPLDNAHPFDQSLILEDQTYQEKPMRNILIIGYNDNLINIIQEEDYYLANDSKITIAASPRFSEEIDKLRNMHVDHSSLDFKICDIDSFDVIKELTNDPFEMIVVLSDSENTHNIEEAEKIDAKTLLVLLHLKALSESKDHPLNVTTELMRVENINLGLITDVRNYVVGQHITSLMMSQVSRLRDLNAIFNELISYGGSEIYINPAGNYVTLGKPVDMYTAGAAVTLHREVLCGYQKYDEDGNNYTMVMNPPKDQPVVFNEHDGFVVIAMELKERRR